MCLSNRYQTGVALIMALVVVSIASILMVSIVHEQSIAIRKTAHSQANEMALLYSYGLEDYAQIILRKDKKESRIDHLKEDWSKGIPILPIQGGMISGQMEDSQSRVNVNAVLDKDAENRLRVLCDNQGVSSEFIEPLKDWLDNDQEARGSNGAEDDYYTSLESPYRAANRNMSDISELLLVKNMSREIYDTIRPYITVLPAMTALNINTISAEVYQTLGDNLNSERFIAEREINPFNDINDYNVRMKHILSEKGISVNSEYFSASGQIVQGEKTLFITVLIHRNKQGKTSLISRKYGNTI